MIEIEDYRALAHTYAVAREPKAIFHAVQSVLEKRIGFSLLTMLMLTADGDEVERLFTTDPVNYPIAGRERLGTTAWGEHVMVQQKPYLGADRAAVEWAFPGDFDLITSLGLGATMNVPIVFLGKTLGSMNILDREGSFIQAHLDAAASLAPYLSAAFLPAVYPTVHS